MEESREASVVQDLSPRVSRLRMTRVPNRIGYYRICYGIAASAVGSALVLSISSSQ